MGQNLNDKLSPPIDISIKVIRDFVWEGVKDWHKLLKNSCDSVQAWRSALQAEAAGQHRVECEILPAVFSTNPYKIVKAFSTIPHDDDVKVEPGEELQDFVHLLDLVKNCKQFHVPCGDDKMRTLNDVIDKVIKVWKPNSIEIKPAKLYDCRPAFKNTVITYNYSIMMAYTCTCLIQIYTAMRGCK